MRFLQLDKKFPYPPRDGGSIATLNISRALAELGHDVTILAMNTEKHFFDPSKLPPELVQSIDFHTVTVDTSIHPMSALMALVRNNSYNVERFISLDYAKTLRDILKSQKPFDVIQLEGLYLIPYVNLIRAETDALISLRAHNVEHTIWERRSAATTGFLKKRYLSILARQLRRYEIEAFNQVDVVIPISPVDAEVIQLLGCRKPMHVCPASYREADFTHGSETVIPNSVFFLGALDWGPNLDGLDWLMSEVWPHVLHARPDAKLHIAGRNMPDRVKSLASLQIQIHGEVADAYQFMREHGVMVVPLLSGSGMRVKIIEGMAHGKPIVTTSIGMEGIPALHNEHLMIADDPRHFADAIIALLNDPSKCNALSANATSFAAAKYGSRQTTQKLVDFYREIIGRDRLTEERCEMTCGEGIR